MITEPKAKAATEKGIKSDFMHAPKCSEMQAFPPFGLAQNGASGSARAFASQPSFPSLELGQPMTIRAVARMLGCSVWTIRQRYLPLGLPHFRLRPAGKLLFFHNQIVRWVLAEQRKKGGMRL